MDFENIYTQFHRAQSLTLKHKICQFVLIAGRDRSGVRFHDKTPKNPIYIYTLFVYEENGSSNSCVFTVSCSFVYPQINMSLAINGKRKINDLGRNKIW